MQRIHPIELHGNWVEGYALDYQMMYSESLNTDRWGHNLFVTKQTVIGELLRKLKYQDHRPSSDELIVMINPFLIKWGIQDEIDYVIPALTTPGSHVQVSRTVQILSEKISRLISREKLAGIIQKGSYIEPDSAYKKRKPIIYKTNTFQHPVNLLLVDEVYETGETLRETVNILKEDANVYHVFVLAMSKANME